MKKTTIGVSALFFAMHVACGGDTKPAVTPVPSVTPTASETPIASAPIVTPAPTTGEATAPAGPRPKGGPYVAGEVFKHLPRDCKGGRVFVDVGRVARTGTISQHAMRALENFAASQRAPQGVFGAFKEGGVDPARDVREFAMCMLDRSDVAVAIGGDFDGVNDPLGIISNALVAAGEKAPARHQVGQAAVLDMKHDGAIALVAPNVLVGGPKGADVVHITPNEGSAGFAPSAGHVAFAKIDEGGGRMVDIVVDEAGGTFDGKVTMEVPPGDRARRDPVKSFKLIQQQAVDEVAKTPFKQLADDMRAAKIELKGDKVVVSFKVSAQHLSDALRTMADMKPEELRRIVH